jgi:hypothetical protein
LSTVNSAHDVTQCARCRAQNLGEGVGIVVPFREGGFLAPVTIVTVAVRSVEVVSRTLKAFVRGRKARYPEAFGTDRI